LARFRTLEMITTAPGLVEQLLVSGFPDSPSSDFPLWTAVTTWRVSAGPRRLPEAGPVVS
jgi:hypothetical protein